MTQRMTRRAASLPLLLAALLAATGCSHKAPATPAAGSTTAPAPAPSPTIPPAVTWDCGEGRTVILKLTRDPNEVWLWLPTKTYKLLRKEAESGQMWSNGNVTFWDKGAQATIRVLDDPIWTCSRQAK